eukprot:TRINITY_DN448_c1_g4_i1.p1 TRINITY_DN448_c1_g4~~TRINITY_DN448_c1_g4_i1.p1  ORF type:complete len:342 (+),score=69.62 TRINITY_DN448_c1_g4_i1:44-1069(+)
MSRTLRRAVCLRQRRNYYPSNTRKENFSFEEEQEKWTDPSCKTRSISELYNRINEPLTECEDILSTWKETKFYNRNLTTEQRMRLTEFLKNKYDHAMEPNFLDRLLLQYMFMKNGSFEHAFERYFRKQNGVTVLDTHPRWSELKKLMYTNIAVLDDLYRLSGQGEGYKWSLGKMMGQSLEHAVPIGKANISEYAKVVFQHRYEGGNGVDLRVLSAGSGNVTYMLLHPHQSVKGMHNLALIILGHENKYKRQTQIPSPSVRESMAVRAARVFALPEGSVDTSVILTPPWLLDRHSLLKIHTLIGGLAPAYSDWLPYYHYELPHDVDYAYQAHKQAEDEFYQL